jgi:endoglucanase
MVCSHGLMASTERTGSADARPPSLVGLLVGLTVAVAVFAGLAGDLDSEPRVIYAPLQHPFHDARLFIDRDTAAAQWQAANGGRWLDPITRRPQARWLTGSRDLHDLPSVARLARQRRELLVLTTYAIPNRDCAGPRVGEPSSAAYKAFINGIVRALGPVRAAIIVEPDAVAAPCFNDTRAALLRYTVGRLAAAGQYVYLDAGHPGWHSTDVMARRLLQSGVNNAQGFAINVANRQTTVDCYSWGKELSDHLGGREFLIDTSRNGLGPPTDRDLKHSRWCNPEQQGLGEAPTTNTGRPGLAALLWIKPPGESDGQCGAEPGKSFSPALAQKLIHNASR